MDIRQYQLVLKEKGTGGPVLRKTFDGAAPVDVREISTQAVLRLSASNVSMYRHCLVLDGKPYDIMNIIELGSGVRPAQPLCVV